MALRDRLTLQHCPKSTLVLDTSPCVSSVYNKILSKGMMAPRPHRPAQTGLSRLLFETNPRPVRSLALGRRLAPASSPCSCPWACHSSIRLPGAAVGASCVTSMPRDVHRVTAPWLALPPDATGSGPRCLGDATQPPQCGTVRGSLPSRPYGALASGGCAGPPALGVRAAPMWL